MATETLHFENPRLAQQLYNSEPQNLQAIHQQLGVKATSREGWIKLDGTPEAIERAKQLFLMLQSSLQSGTPIRNREFTHALGIVREEGVSTLKDVMSDRIQTSDKSPPSPPKPSARKSIWMPSANTT